MASIRLINISLIEANIFAETAFSGKLHCRRSALAKLVNNLDHQDGQDADVFSVVHFVIHKIVSNYSWHDDLAPYHPC